MSVCGQGGQRGLQGRPSLGRGRQPPLSFLRSSAGLPTLDHLSAGHWPNASVTLEKTRPSFCRLGGEEPASAGDVAASLAREDPGRAGATGRLTPLRTKPGCPEPGAALSGEPGSWSPCPQQERPRPPAARAEPMSSGDPELPGRGNMTMLKQGCADPPGKAGQPPRQASAGQVDTRKQNRGCVTLLDGQ